MKPSIVFQGGPLDSENHPNHLQVFASQGEIMDKPDKYIPCEHGTYVAEMKDGEKTIYVWKGTRP